MHEYDLRSSDLIKTIKHYILANHIGDINDLGDLTDELANKSDMDADEKITEIVKLISYRSGQVDTLNYLAKQIDILVKTKELLS
jgi:hypothetical protein